MVTVDLTTASTYTFLGSKFWGAAMHSSINARAQFAFPQPGEVYARLRWQIAHQAQPQPWRY